MTALQSKIEGRSRSLMASAALLLAIVAIVLAGSTAFRQQPGPTTTATPSTLAKIRSERVLNVGYGVWSPYTQLEPGLEEPSGFSVDLIKEIASRSDLKIKFHQFRWETLKPDLMRGKWDVAIEPVFVTMPRALDFGFTEPYGRFGIACAVVSKDDDRFKRFEDLDRPDITIALAKGWTSSEFAENHLSKPNFQMVSLQQDNFAQLNEVLLGRADVALNDAPTVFEFVKEHSDKVKALWLEDPPSIVVGGMLTRPDDLELQNFLNSSIRVLKADGTIRKLDEKWKPLAYYQTEEVSLGAGFKE